MKSPLGSLLGWMSACCVFSGTSLSQTSGDVADLEWVAGEGNFEFGSGFCLAGDIDGDGVLDVAIADRTARVDGFFASGKVQVVSGKDGSLIRTYLGEPSMAQYFGFSMASLDANGDGVSDLAVGAPGQLDEDGFRAGGVTIYSGVDGAVLGTVIGPGGSQFGTALVNAGDQNGDGIEDLHVGAPIADGFKGEVFTLSGSDLALLRRVGTDASSSGFGSVLVALDDRDGDGLMDLAVSSPSFTQGGDFYKGRVQLIRSSDGSVAAEIAGSGVYNRLGNTMAPAPDQNQDGISDLLVGSFWHGTLKLVSGADLSTLSDLSMTLPANRPVNAGGVLDLDGDQVDDFLIGSNGLALVDGNLVGGVRVISGADGSTLFERLGSAAPTGLGSVQTVLPGLGFAVGERRLFNEDTGGYGAAYLWKVDLVRDSDGDGIPDDQDLNPNSNLDALIRILGRDTGVGNFVDDNGLTLADRFDDLGSLEDFRNPTHYFTSVVHLTNDLVEEELINERERKAINAAARDGAVQTRGKGGR
ncbi:MAG: integrin alpha [Akkermansiaceae bacterium]|nr:integrin alpha [Akkermansiaceae bacterium]